MRDGAIEGITWGMVLCMALKVTGVIDWHWAIVLLPAWGSWSLLAAIITVTGAWHLVGCFVELFGGPSYVGPTYGEWMK